MTNRLVQIESDIRKRALGVGMGPAAPTARPVRTGRLLHTLARATGVAYDRASALAYARTFWNVPCSDGVVATSTGGGFSRTPAGTRFVHDADGTEHAEDPTGATVLGWHDLDDCTHFISCCIGRPPRIGQRFDRADYEVEPAGGLDVPSRQMGFPTYGFVRVSSLVEWLLSSGAATAVATKTHDPAKLRKLEPGDLIAYFDPARKRYQHFAMLLDGGKIVCHSVCRSDDPACTWDNDWNVDGGSSLLWTFLKMR